MRRSILILLAASPSHADAQLAYAEISTGLNAPAWDGGRTTLRLADLNLDSHPDLVSVGDHGSPYINTQMHGVSVWFGDGRNHWSVFQHGDFGYGGVAVGDVNNDNLPDVAYGVHHNYSNNDLGDQLLEVALGDGTGTAWTPWDNGLAAHGQDWGMFGTELADFNADGWLDVASVAFGYDDGIHAYLNNRDGSWTRSFGFIGGNSTMDIGSGDINNDGAVDLITAHQSGSVWINNGQGAFTKADANLPAGGNLGRRGPSTADVDLDGRDDFAYATNSGGASVWRSLPGGTWQNFSGTLPTSGTIEETHLADMNADGVIDLVTFGEGQGRVWLGDAAGNWTSAAAFSTPSPGDYAALTVADADHNGRPDIAILSDEGSFSNLRNKLHLFSETSIPTTPSVRVTSPTINRSLRAGSVLFIDWLAAVPDSDDAVVALALSRSGPEGPWRTITPAAPNNGRAQCILNTAGPSTNAYIRATLSTASHGDADHLIGPITILGADCPADFNNDATVNTLDVLTFLNAWAASLPTADFNADGTVNTLDVLAFLNAWTASCL